nr:basic proline-rich protein-like [Zonotrichia albicollis]
MCSERSCLSREFGPEDPLWSLHSCPALRFRAERARRACPGAHGSSGGGGRQRKRCKRGPLCPLLPPSLPPPPLPAAALAAPRLCPRRWGMFIVAGSRPSTRNAAGRPAPTDRHRAAPCPAPPRPPPARTVTAAARRRAALLLLLPLAAVSGPRARPQPPPPFEPPRPVALRRRPCPAEVREAARGLPRLSAALPVPPAAVQIAPGAAGRAWPGPPGQGEEEGAGHPAGERPVPGRPARPRGLCGGPVPRGGRCPHSRRCRAAELSVARPPCCLRFVCAVPAAEVSGWG